MKPTFGSGLLFDSHTEMANNKINGQGVINIFRAWDFPCFRSATAIISCFRLSKGITTGDIFFSKLRGVKEELIGSFEISAPTNNTCISITTPLLLRLDKTGYHYIKAVFHNYKSTMKIPFTVNMQKWPIFSKEEQLYIKNNRNLFGSLRVNVHCQKCKHAYIFEENITEEVVTPGGVMIFPESGKYKCTECGEIIYLRDIQGQIRFTLKQMILQSKKGQYNV